MIKYKFLLYYDFKNDYTYIKIIYNHSYLFGDYKNELLIKTVYLYNHIFYFIC